MRILLAFIIVLMCHSISAQISFSRYFDYSFLPVADFIEHRDVPIEWNFDGKLQAVVNSGLTDLKEQKYDRAIHNFDLAIQMDQKVWVSYYYRGICNKITDNLEKAKDDLLIALYRSGEKAEVYVELAEIYQAEKDFEKADQYFTKAKELQPGHVDGYFGIANVAFLERKVEKAIRYYKQCIEVNPSFPNSYLKIALLKLFVNEREKQALSYLDQAVEADPGFEEGFFWRGLINVQFNNIDKGLEDWNRLVQRNPDNPLYTMVRGYLYIELQNYEKAFVDLKNAVIAAEPDENSFGIGIVKAARNRQIDLHSASVYLMRNIYGLNEVSASRMKKGYCHMVASKHRAALEQFSLAIRNQPSACGYLFKAMAHEYLLESDSAFANYDKTLSLDNEIFDAHKKRALYRTSIKDWKGANLDFLAMEKIQPQSIITYKLRGTLKNSLKDYYGTIVDLTRYMKSDSSDWQIVQMRALAQRSVGNFVGSRDDFKRLVILRPEDPSPMAELYISHIILKDTTQAWATLEEHQKKFPEAAFSRIQKMDLLIAKDSLDEAKKVFTEFMATTGYKRRADLSELHYLMGMVHVKKDEIEAAINEFSNSIEIGNEGSYKNLDAYFQRGKILWESGKKKKAISDFKILKENGYSQSTSFIDSVLSQE